MFNHLYVLLRNYILPVLSGLILASGCSEEDNGLAPYAGAPEMSGIRLEENSFKPKMTWLGGYVSVVGVNRGTRAALDSSLIWLIYLPQNGIKYPVQFGTIPEGAQELTPAFGGVKQDSLIEDRTYTFWLMKEALWQKVSDQDQKIFATDSLLGGDNFVIDADTIRLSPESHLQSTKNLDVYINLREIKPRGKLAVLDIFQVKTDVYVTWEIWQSDVTDSALSVIGLNEGGQYNNDAAVWEIWSTEIINGVTEYGTRDILQRPLRIGQDHPQTKAFAQFPAEGLQRGKIYYLWVAQSGWDREKRLRSTPFYASLTFETW